MVPQALAWLAACATACGGAGRPVPVDPESPWLGPFARSRCFHVNASAPNTYHFVIDDVVYPRALGAGQVAIIVHAVDVGDLAPRPVTLRRDPRLEFIAEGAARGAFELVLFLVDSGGRESKPERLDTICATPLRGS
jgi:hypothetical protein